MVSERHPWSPQADFSNPAEADATSDVICFISNSAPVAQLTGWQGALTKRTSR
jgi:hypothetical protein